MLTDSVNFLPGMAPASHGQAGLVMPGAAYQPGWRDPDTKSALIAEVYRKDVVFKLKDGRKRKPRVHERGEIKGFSASAARRLRLLIRNTDDLWTGFVTLTYPGHSFSWSPSSLDGRKCKKHVHAFCTWLGRKKIAYVWVLEFQRRGVPHFHFLVSGWVDKAELSRRWYEIVGSNDPRHLASGTQVDACRNPEEAGIYLTKYMAKLEDKDGFQTKAVPEGFKSVGRFWGASRCLSKTVYRMKGLRREMTRELRVWRKENQGTRRGISAEQAARAERFEQEAQNLCLTDRARRERLLWARKARARARGYAKRWKWKGQGFILLRGAGSFKSMLRQAVAVDRGLDPWEEWDGKPDPCRYEKTDGPPGQFDLFGGFDPFYPPEPETTYCGTCAIWLEPHEMKAHRRFHADRQEEA